MTCPNCDVPTPRCPVCGLPMMKTDRRMPPGMGSSMIRLLDHRWWCSQSDGLGTSHHVELTFPHKEK